MDMTTEMSMTTDAPLDDASQTTTVNNEITRRRAPLATSHRIDLEPAYRVDAKGRGAGHGRAVMVYQGAVVGESREPAFAAARFLLANGLALPSDGLVTYRNGRPCLFSSIGRCAKLAVAESGKSGPRIVAYREAPVEMLKALRTPGDDND